MAPVCTSCIISSPGWHQHAPCWTQRFTAQAFNKTDLGFYLAQETFQRTGNRKGGAAMIRSAVETAVVPHWNGQLGFNVVCLRYLYIFICCSSFLKPSWPFQQTSYVLYFTVVPLCVVFCCSFDCYGAISKMCCFHSKPDPRISSDAEASSWGHRKVDGCFQLVDFREFHIIYIISYIYIYHICYVYIIYI